MNIEIQTSAEAARLLLRDPGKYIHGVKGLYLLSFVDCELGQVARTSYFVLRQIDDLLDGERKGEGDPLLYALHLREQIKSDKFDESYPLAVLASRSISLLEARATYRDNPRQEFIAAIDSMIFDFNRAKNRQVLSPEELKTYYQKTFSPVINLMLIGLKSRFRAEDIPELIFCQGRVYSVRDLRDDWKIGIINIPDTVLEEASLSATSTYEDISSSEFINNWFLNELSQSRGELQELKTQLSGSSEWLTVRMCNGLIDPMLRFIGHFETDRD